MEYRGALARRLVAVIAASAFEETAIRRSIVVYLGPMADPVAWRIAGRLRTESGVAYRQDGPALAAMIAEDPDFEWFAYRLWERATPLPEHLIEPPVMAASPAFAKIDPPPWTTPGDLAEAFGETPEALHWLADLDGRAARSVDPKARHYHCAWLAKPGGGRRLIEAPKRRLKTIQRRILHEILHLAPAHPAAIAYVPGRRVADGAARHAGEAMVLTLDLRRFFQSIPARRVHGLFRCLGYPYAAARILTGLTTTRVIAVDVDPPLSVWERALLRTPHLPQGAPTSPALANLCAHRLDCRLAGLARTLGATYTRYADDLAFSGDAPLGAAWVRRAVGEIVEEEGFRLAPEKTRVQPARGRQTVTGIVVNQHVNLRRRDFDTLKATLTNCVRHGPASQNRAQRLDFRAHLDGRVHWVEQLNRPRGAKLRAIFDRICW